jgi:hypothetical protein
MQKRKQNPLNWRKLLTTYKHIPFEQLEEAILADDYIGFCLNCGEEKYNIEPDARHYPCDVCEEEMAFGAQEILFMQGVEE